MTATLLPATAISNKDHRRVAAEAIEAGWGLVRSGGDHFQLQAVGSSDVLHVVTLSGTPSRPAVNRIERELERCYTGACSHGGRVSRSAKVVEQRREAAKQREAEQLRHLEQAALTRTHTAPFSVKVEVNVASKPKRKASRPAYEKALKWVRWWTTSTAATAAMTKGPIPQKRIDKEASEAGHKWVQVRLALIEVGAQMEYRGRNGTFWILPPTTEGGTGSSEPVEVDPVVVAVDKAAGLDVEWARLEGMAAMVSPTLVEQVAKVRGMVDA